MSRSWWRHNLRSPQKLFFQICLNYISLGFFLCTDQFFNKTLWLQNAGKTRYCVRYKMLWCHNWLVRKLVFLLDIAMIYIIQRSFTADHFLLKDSDLEATQKRNIWHTKKSKARNHCIEVRWGQLKAVSFYIIHNLYMKQQWQM